MNIFEFEKAAQEGKLDVVLKLIDSDIKLAEHYNNLLKNNIVQNPEIIIEAIQVISGLYGSFCIAENIIETVEESIKSKKYLEIKNGTKGFLATNGRMEAINHVSNYSRIRAILQAYTKQTEKNVSTCQSILSYFKATYNRKLEE